jgi:hypothetical protein
LRRFYLTDSRHVSDHRGLSGVSFP